MFIHANEEIASMKDYAKIKAKKTLIRVFSGLLAFLFIASESNLIVSAEEIAEEGYNYVFDNKLLDCENNTIDNMTEDGIEDDVDVIKDNECAVTQDDEIYDSFEDDAIINDNQNESLNLIDENQVDNSESLSDDDENLLLFDEQVEGNSNQEDNEQENILSSNCINSANENDNVDNELQLCINAESDEQYVISELQSSNEMIQTDTSDSWDDTPINSDMSYYTEGEMDFKWSSCGKEDVDCASNDYIDYMVDKKLFPRYYSFESEVHTFSGLKKEIYDDVRILGFQCASANSSTPKIEITCSFDDEHSMTRYYNASDLGVDDVELMHLYNGDKDIYSSDVVESALSEYRQFIDGEINEAIRSAFDENRYSYFWSTGNYICDNKSSYSRYVDLVDGEYRLYFYTLMMETTITFDVRDEYKGTDGNIDLGKIQAITTTIDNVAWTIQGAANLDDWDKLCFYRDAICGYTDYDYPAFWNSDYSDNAYSMESVFDGDSNTQTVCQGYAEAFAYLCDKTVFTDQSIKCYLVAGNVEPNDCDCGHAWNIVHWKDGFNYLVDITNYDGDNYGVNYDSFMVTAECGSIEEGYQFELSAKDYTQSMLYKYTYYDSIKKKYTQEQLQISVQTIKGNGLVRNSDGIWYYVIDDKVQNDYTGLVSYNGGWYYVQNGVLKWGVKTLVQYNGTWYYVNNSTVDWSYTGLVQFNNNWYYIQKGVLKWGVRTLVQYNGTWYYVDNSTLDWNYTGIFNYGGTDYYIQNGSIKWGVNGLTNVKGTWYYLNNSAVKRGYTGLVQLNNNWYYVQKGELKWGVRTLVQYNGTWYYVNNSTLDWNYTGIFNYGGTDYYIQKGSIKWGVNGLTNVKGTWYYLNNSAVKRGYTGLVQFNNNWYYVQKGELKWGVRTLVQYNGTWYYINNSTLDWNYTGIFNYGGTDYYIQKGSIKWGVNGLTNVKGTWYYLSNSAVKRGYTGLVQFNNNWYFVQRGALNWGVRTLVQYNGTWYYVNNSTVDWKYTGLCEYNGKEYYVKEGVAQLKFSGLTVINGKWYYIDYGVVTRKH